MVWDQPACHERALAWWPEISIEMAARICWLEMGECPEGMQLCFPRWMIHGMAWPKATICTSFRKWIRIGTDAGLVQKWVTRAVVAADFDRQGGLEILIVNVETPSILVTPPEEEARELFVEAVDEAGQPVLHALVFCQTGDQNAKTATRHLRRVRLGPAPGGPLWSCCRSSRTSELEVQWPDGN